MCMFDLDKNGKEDQEKGIRFIATGRRRGEYYISYTVLFVFAAAVVFSWYFFSGRTLIWKGDGWSQHYKALVYYAEYLRSIVRDLIERHQLVIPEWDFGIGEGSDILGTLHYYVIGDPFTFFSVFVPSRFMYVYYDVMILLRLYLAGIAFSCLCFGTGKKSRYAVLAGAMTYVFCYWAILNAARHPYFLNPMIYLPALVMGVEKILRKEKPYLLICMVFLSAVSNFYFFYILAFVTAIYVVVRLAGVYRRNWREGIVMLLKIGASAVFGVLLAAAIFLPVCYVFLSDARMGEGHTFHLLYPASYYRQLFSVFISGGYPYWMCMGYAAPVLPAVFLLFAKRKNGLLKSLFLIGVLIMLVPVFGQALNGFSYMANRWSWAFALVSAYILTAVWPELMRLGRREAVILSVCMAGWFAACMMMEESHTDGAISSMLIAAVFIVGLLLLKGRHGVCVNRWQQSFALLLVLLSVFVNSYWKNSEEGENYASQSVATEKLPEKLSSDETEAVHNAADEDGAYTFYRYSGRAVSANAGMLAGMSSTQYYWSLSNPYISEFRKALELREALPHRYNGYDDRTALNTLACVRYYTMTVSNAAHLPYGFMKPETEEEISESGFSVYRNEYVLPLAYTYDSYISARSWEKLTAVGKQEALLQDVVLEEYDGVIGEKAPKLTGREVDCSVECDDKGVAMRHNTFVVKSPGASVRIKCKGFPKSEAYLSIHGLDVRGVKEKTELDLMASTGMRKKFMYYTDDYRSNGDRHDFSINFCYAKRAVQWFTITFTQEGVYSFDSIKVICQPMKDYAAEVSERSEDVLEKMKIGTDTISGKITLEKPKLLCLAVPYSAGWRAYVDGKETKLYRANVMYMALELGEGNHSVRLVYHTPLLREGVAISVAAAIVFVLAVLVIRLKPLLLLGRSEQ